MGAADVKLDLPGLLREPLPSGGVRYRVRVAGNPSRRIPLAVTPDHPEFLEIYRAARAGVRLDPTAKPADRAIHHSVGWLCASYLEHLEDMVKAGKASAATVKQRRHLFTRLCDHKATSGRATGQPFRDLHMMIPTDQLVAFRDHHAATSGMADNALAAIRAMYRWAVARQIAPSNPAAGVARIHQYQGGATPWTADDLKAFRDRWPAGTRPHLALTLLMFTAARVSDAIRLGRRHEFQKGGVTWIDWTPQKKHARRVRIPMAPQLAAAIRAHTVIGPTYLLTSAGKSWASVDSFRNQFKEWCIAAGLPDRSPHGIRKAAGTLLAEHGATQYGIMSIHGHADPATSKIYTEAVARDQLAATTAAIFGHLEW